MVVNKEKFIYLLSEKALSSFKLLCDDILIKPLTLVSISYLFKQLGYLLITATAIDQISKYNRFLLQYIFVTYTIPQRIYININTNLQCESIKDVFSTAIWLEREIYDLFGLFFENRESTNDLRRILTDYHFKGHPLRKDFALIGYNEKLYSYLTKSIRNNTEVIF